MKITFIYPDFGSDYPGWRGAYYVGLGSLAGSLKAQGHEVSLIHIWDPAITKAAFLQEVREHQADLLAFSSTTLTFPFVRRTIEWLRQDGIKTPTLAGGIHVTLDRNYGLDTPGLDIACVGEGEVVLVELCRRLSGGLSYDNIPGIASRANGEIRYNGPAPKIHDLDSLPFPDRQIFDYANLHYERQGMAMIMASRGCPFKCTYCSNEALRNVLGKKDVVRFHSVDYVIEEAKQILAKYPFIKCFQFDDDVLFMRRGWAEEFADRFPKEVGAPFDCNLRPNMADNPTVKMLAAAGCREIKFGLESGNDHIRTQILGRQLSKKQIVDAVRNSQRAGMHVRTFNMIGLPFETPATALDTIKLNAEANPDTLLYTVFYPFPGTKLFDICRENDFLTDKTRYDFFGASVLNQKTISARQVFMFWYLFTGLVKLYRLKYKLPAPLGQGVAFTLDRLLGSSRTATPTLMILAQPINLYRRVKRLLTGGPAGRGRRRR